MLVIMGLDMFTHLLLKNNKKNIYVKSKRTYLNDYLYKKNKKINMISSGSYMCDYKKIEIGDYRFDKYCSKKELVQLKETIKERNYIKDNYEIIIGSGSNGIIQNIIKICFEHRGNLVTTFYTFDEVEYGCTSFNSITKRVFMNDDASVNYKNINASIDRKTKLVYICNPNNTTGIYENPKEIIKIANKNKKIMFLIDEAGIEFTKQKGILEYKIPKNIIIVRTLSKAYGLANLRVGYLICSKEFAKIYYSKTTINEVSGLSIHIANQYYKSNDYKKNVLETNKERIKIEKILIEKGIELYNSSSNIILTKNQPKWFKEYINNNDISLLEVKDNENNIHYRIAVQDKATNQLFIEKIGGGK